MTTRKLTTMLGAAALAALLAAPTFAANRSGAGGSQFSARSQGTFGASSTSRQGPATDSGDKLQTQDRLHTQDQLPDQDQLRTRDKLHDKDGPDQDQLRTRDQLKDGTGLTQ